MVTGDPGRPLHVLVVCRFNQARSPIAAHLLRTYATDHGLNPLPVVSSSGMLAAVDKPLPREFARMLAARGQDAPDHAARRFHLAEARAAALVITFERELVGDIVRQDAALGARTFTLRELRRLVASPLWDEEWNGGPELASRLHRLRPRVAAGDDDTPDPAGGRGRIAQRVLTSVIEDTMAVAPVLLGDHSVVT